MVLLNTISSGIASLQHIGPYKNISMPAKGRRCDFYLYRVFSHDVTAAILVY